jgi:hypothetical protein
MARKQEKQARGVGRLREAADAVKRLLFGGRDRSKSASPEAAAPRSSTKNAAPPARPAQRTTDIPMELLEGAYTPAATSSKASFRSDGADHQNDQELALGVADDRWNDEDRLTNKSGDPRIGTHRRTYEPGESRPESRN